MLLAAGKEVAAEKTKYKGAYIGSTCKIEPLSPLARDAVVAENLWKLSEEALAKWIKE
jgi:hypothetical protein